MRHISARANPFRDERSAMSPGAGPLPPVAPIVGRVEAAMQAAAGLAASSNVDGLSAETSSFSGTVDPSPRELVMDTSSLSKVVQTERIRLLLAEFGRQRPQRIPFVPLEAPSDDGDGLPYIHGSLEVRLCLTPDGNQLLVRVGAEARGAGRFFEVADFVDRAEAVEARRVQRPIAEDSVLSDSNFLPAAAGSLARQPTSPSGDLSALLGVRKEPTGPQALPWKKLFKSNWAPSR